MSEFAPRQRPGRARLRQPGETEDAYQKRLAKLEADRVRKARSAKARRARQQAAATADGEAAVAATHGPVAEPSAPASGPSDHDGTDGARRAARLQSDQRRRAALAQAKKRELLQALAAAGEPATAAECEVSSIDDVEALCLQESNLNYSESKEQSGKNSSHAGSGGERGGREPPPLTGGGSLTNPPFPPPVLAGRFSLKLLKSLTKADKTSKSSSDEEQLSAPAEANARARASRARHFPPDPAVKVPPAAAATTAPPPPTDLELAEMWLLSRWLRQARVCAFGLLAVRCGSSQRRRLARCYELCEGAAAAGEPPLQLLLSRLSYAVEALAVRFPAVTIDELLDLTMMLDRPLRTIPVRPAVIVRRFAAGVAAEVAAGRLAVLDGREVAHG